MALVAGSLFLLLMTAAGGGQTTSAPPPATLQREAAQATMLSADDPDNLYKHREDLGDAKRAADIWQRTSDTTYNAAWKLARVCYYLGTHLPEKERDAALDRGVAAGQAATRIDGGKPEGHFWLAANMGEKSQQSSIYAGTHKGAVKTELERVIKIEPGWQGGSAEAALGQWYHKVPSNMAFSLVGLGGGDDKKAEQLFKRALAFDENNKPALMFYAELLVDQKRYAEARTRLDAIIAQPINADWGPEELEFQKEAADLLTKIKGK